MESNMEKTVYDVKMKQDAVWGLAVSVFWLAAAVFLYASGALALWSLDGELRGLIAMLAWIAGAVFGVIGLIKGIRLIWQNWS